MSELHPSEPIDKFELTARAEHALRHHGIKTIALLTEFSGLELVNKVENFGRVSLADVETELARRGFHLRPEAEPRSTEFLIWALRSEIDDLSHQLRVAQAQCRRLEESRDFWTTRGVA